MSIIKRKSRPEEMKNSTPTERDLAVAYKVKQNKKRQDFKEIEGANPSPSSIADAIIARRKKDNEDSDLNLSEEPLDDDMMSMDEPEASEEMPEEAEEEQNMSMSSIADKIRSKKLKASRE